MLRKRKLVACPRRRSGGSFTRETCGYLAEENSNSFARKISSSLPRKSGGSFTENINSSFMEETNNFPTGGNSIKSSRRFYRRVKPGNRCSRFRGFPCSRESRFFKHHRCPLRGSLTLVSRRSLLRPAAPHREPDRRAENGFADSNLMRFHSQPAGLRSRLT